MKSTLIKRAVLALGLGLMLISIPMSTYTDFQEFMSSAPRGDSKKYHEMREVYLTNKHRIFDLGLTIVIASVMFFGFGKRWNGVWSSLSSVGGSVKMAFALPILFGACYVFDIFQIVFRGEVPTWADTPAIPLLALPILVGIVGAYTVVHLMFVPRPYPGIIPIQRLFSRKANPLLLLSLAGVTAQTLLTLLVLEPLYTFPFALISYYVASVTAARAVTRNRDYNRFDGSDTEA